MATRHRVHLTDEERQGLRHRVAAGRGSARALAHARILLKADESAGGPAWPDEEIARALDVGAATIWRVRRRFVEHGLEAALGRKPPDRVYRRKVDGEAEAHLVALACSPPPLGRRRWTLRLLADKAVELRFVDGLSYETVRRVLKKTT
jgi:transposase